MIAGYPCAEMRNSETGPRVNGVIGFSQRPVSDPVLAMFPFCCALDETHELTSERRVPLTSARRQEGIDWSTGSRTGCAPVVTILVRQLIFQW